MTLILILILLMLLLLLLLCDICADSSSTDQRHCIVAAASRPTQRAAGLLFDRRSAQEYAVYFPSNAAKDNITLRLLWQ